MDHDVLIEKLCQQRCGAPRLTAREIASQIVDCTYTTLPSQKAMVCELTLRNGFTVRGDSACVSKENFDQTIGEKVAYKKAFDKIWELEGYLLQDRLHEAKAKARQQDEG
ncbi:MAG: hypothetical protein EOO38_00835 [Cytophagaceae bacterium]|nr:MAG: hypothetical protein EOO38_00835 [Cytophagaceae bacterium]